MVPPFCCTCRHSSTQHMEDGGALTRPRWAMDEFDTRTQRLHSTLLVLTGIHQRFGTFWSSLKVPIDFDKRLFWWCDVQNLHSMLSRTIWVLKMFHIISWGSHTWFVQIIFLWSVSNLTNNHQPNYGLTYISICWLVNIPVWNGQYPIVPLYDHLHKSTSSSPHWRASTAAARVGT